MASKSEKMYKDSPELERDEKSGKMAVKKRADKKDNEAVIGDGELVDARHASERSELKHRHVSEHLKMHHRHEMEHSSHTGEITELHKRHMTELKAMHGEHEGEHKAMYARHEKELHGKKLPNQNKEEEIHSETHEKE